MSGENNLHFIAQFQHIIIELRREKQGMLLLVAVHTPSLPACATAQSVLCSGGNWHSSKRIRDMQRVGRRRRRSGPS